MLLAFDSEPLSLQASAAVSKALNEQNLYSKDQHALVKHGVKKMKKIEDMTVKEMALLSGVTIRTLHHYDDIGLLKANRTESGYRMYTEKHALRLQQILLQKSFGLPLEDIARNLDDANFDTLLSLQQQRNAVVKQAENISAIIEAIDMAIKQLTNEDDIDLRDIFKGFDPSLYEEEA